MLKSLVSLVSISCLLTACALTPQEVNFSPEVQVSSTTKGNGQKVVLTTVDERTSSTIGNRAIAGFGADITTSDDIAKVVHNEISRALEAQDFLVSGMKNGEPKELRVEVRNIDYKLTQGIFTGTLRAESVLKGICLIDDKRVYEHLYRGESTEQVLVVQFAEENAAHINKALSNSIENLLGDDQLIGCLAKPSM